MRLWNALPLLLLALPACSRPDTGGGAEDAYRGRVLAEALAKPDFRLTDTRGQPFDFRRDTRGSLALLFIGYTNCPDVCPVHMANLAAVLKDLPEEVGRQVKVVFVTSDPERDTPEVIRSWLDGFDPDFIGLRGTVEQVHAIETALRLPHSVRGVDEETGKPFVGHASHVVAFTADGKAHVVYPFGTRQSDWAHDLPRLVRGGWSGS